MSPVLEWVPLLIICLNSAMESIKGYGITPIKNLSSKIDIMVKEPVSDKDKKHVRNICSNFCQANQSHLKALSFGDDKIELLIYVKYKNGPAQKNDPLGRKGHDRARGEEKKSYNGQGYNVEGQNPRLRRKDPLQVHSRETLDLDYLRDSTNSTSKQVQKDVGKTNDGSAESRV